MSFVAEGWAWEQECPTSAAKLVLVCLAWYANKEGERAFPSIQTICRRTHLNPKTVRKALSALCASGLTERCLRPGDDANKPHLSAEYRLKIGDTPLPNTEGVPLPNTEREGIPKMGGEGIPNTEGGNTKNGPPPLPKQGGNLSNEPRKEPESNIHSLESYRARGKPKRQRATPKPRSRTTIPEDWSADGKASAFATERGVPLAEIARFVAYHQANGTDSADWGASWRTWCLNYVRYRDQRSEQDNPPARPTSPYRQPVPSWCP